MKEMPWLADLHTYSTFSIGKLSIPQLVDAYGRRGFGAIAITDLFYERGSLSGRSARLLNRSLTEATFPLYMEILRSEARRAWYQYSMVVIPGFEIARGSRRSSVHLLCLGGREFAPADLSKTDLIQSASDHGLLAVATNPRSFKSRKPHGPWSENDRAPASSELPLIASSQPEKRAWISGWKTVLTCERSEHAILSAIRERNVGFQDTMEVKLDLFPRADGGHGLGLRHRGRLLGDLPARPALRLDTGS